jgi:hypothetical protein
MSRACVEPCSRSPRIPASRGDTTEETSQTRYKDVHVGQDSIICEAGRCDPYKPTRDAGAALDQECPAYRAAFDCLMKVPNTPGYKDSWEELFHLINDWRKTCQAAGKW